MFKCYLKETKENVVHLFPVETNHFTGWLEKQDEQTKALLSTQRFKEKSKQYCFLPGLNGEPLKILVGIASFDDRWAFGELPLELSEGIYQIDAASMTTEQLQHATIAWGLGAYQFDRYKTKKTNPPQLIVDKQLDMSSIMSWLETVYMVRDLINTPAEDMGPEGLWQATVNLSHNFGAITTQIIGDDLLKKNFPAIHRVGRAGAEAPRLIDLEWGEGTHPRVTLVGKGVCFDTGGLDLKPSQYMRLMKKDMGGAAHVLGLARMIMAANLPVRLRVLIPAVENNVSANAYRPGDVIKMRKGNTVEVGNTDAEGRLVLADALTEAMSQNPRLLIDFATLTGAARAALGTEIPVFFSNKFDVAGELIASSHEQQEPIWQLPLHEDYKVYLQSKVADLSNNSSVPYGGAITAALFLQEFVSDATKWLHFDIMGWNIKDKAGRPEGGEAMGLKSVFSFIEKNYPRKTS